MKKKCKNKDFRGTALATQKIYLLKFNQCMKSDKTPCIIYADLKSLIKKIDNCKNNPEKSSTTKMGEHIPCGYLILTMWTFDRTKNKHSLYRAQDCMKKFVFF